MPEITEQHKIVTSLKLKLAVGSMAVLAQLARMRASKQEVQAIANIVSMVATLPEASTTEQLEVEKTAVEVAITKEAERILALGDTEEKTNTTTGASA